MSKLPEHARQFMQEAVDLSAYSMKKGGGPFGAVIVKDDKIIGRGHNMVTMINDPTAHAEVSAIRDACKNVKSFLLEDCQIYTSCEPCPMCLTAVMWARINAIYFANDQKDAAEIGFDDEFFYQQVRLPAGERAVPGIHMPLDTAKQVFKSWMTKNDKTEY